MQLGISERFWSKVDKNGPIPEYRPELGPCWIWNGTILKRQNYGQFWRTKKNGGRIMAHRFSYEEKHGPTDAETLDHLCRVHPCVNYDHLEPASTYENVVVRGTGITAINAKKEVHSTCGGPYSVIQSGKHKGMRYCKACAKERRKNERQRKGMGSCIAQR